MQVILKIGYVVHTFCVLVYAMHTEKGYARCKSCRKSYQKSMNYTLLF